KADDAALDVDRKRSLIASLYGNIPGVDRAVPVDAADFGGPGALDPVHVGGCFDLAVFQRKDLPERIDRALIADNLELPGGGEGGRALEAVPAIDRAAGQRAIVAVGNVGEPEPGLVGPASRGFVAQAANVFDLAGLFQSHRFQAEARLK